MAECWKGVLDEHAVDGHAQHAFFALAQSSAWGRSRAFGIMSKLWKKVIDRERLHNSSAFIWKNVRSSWDEVDWG